MSSSRFKGGYSSWLLVVCGLVFLAACTAPVSKNPVILPIGTAGETSTIVMPTLTQTAGKTQTATGTPVLLFPTPTPTITAELLPPALASLQIAYENQGYIQLWKSGRTTDLVAYTGQPRTMDYEGFYNTSPLLFSDDGFHLAFLQLDGSVWVVRADGSDPRLIYAETGTNSAYERPCLIGWLPGTHTLLFSKIHWLATGIYSQSGTFYTANIDTAEVNKHEVFPDKGAAFYPAPSGTQVAVVSDGKLAIIEASGEDFKLLHSFPRISTIVWSKDADSLVVVVPPGNPDESPDRLSQVWQVFVDDQPAVRLSRLPAAAGLEQDIEVAVWIAPDLTHLAYFNRVNDQENLYELHVAGIDLSNDQPVFQGDAGQVVWAPDAQRFVVWRSSTTPAFVLVDIAGNLRELTTLPAQDIVWIDDENLLLFNGREFWWVGENHQRVLLATREESNKPLRYFRQFDFRLPNSDSP